nr:MAG TPA: hypothetical protein [Caudoviricetes sp.]
MNSGTSVETNVHGSYSARPTSEYKPWRATSPVE